MFQNTFRNFPTNVKYNKANNVRNFLSYSLRFTFANVQQYAKNFNYYNKRQ